MAATVPVFSARAQAFFPLLAGLVAITIVSILGDAVVGIYPLRAGDPQWRVLAVGQMLGLVPQLAVLLGLVGTIGVVGGVRLALRAVAIVAIVIGVGTLIVLIPFGLDFLQVRRMVAESNKRKVDLATLKTTFFSVLFALALVWTGIRAWPLSRKESSVEREPGGGLIVGQR